MLWATYSGYAEELLENFFWVSKEGFIVGVADIIRNTAADSNSFNGPFPLTKNKFA